MSDLELTDPYDPDPFDRGPRGPAAPKPASLAPLAKDVEGPFPPPAPQAGAPAEKAREGSVPWKAAASSVPRLRQQPASCEPADTEGSFQGFAQDAMPTRAAAMMGESPRLDAETGPDDDPGAPARPLAAALPFWEVWLERVREVPAPLWLGACAVLLLAVILTFALRPGDPASVSISRIRQHPEAFDGRHVAVRGKAGESFLIGGSYVFNLRQGRDTIVVYSRTRRPSLHEDVRAAGTVSIGYLDGAPRLALFEEPQTP